MFAIPVGSYQTVPYPGKVPIMFVIVVPAVQWIFIDSSEVLMSRNNFGFENTSMVD